MNKKEKILAKLSDQRKNLKKINLSIVSDLKESINNLNTFDIERDYDVAIKNYEYALGLMEQAIQAANAYVESYSKFEENIGFHLESYSEASRLMGELRLQLDYLGVEPSSEIEYFDDIVFENESLAQNAFDKSQSDFGKHNDLVDISDFN